MYYTVKVLIALVLANSITGEKHLGDHCDGGWDCSRVTNAECINETCKCSHNTIPHDGECVQVSEPETTCTTNLECQLSNDHRRICVAHKCRCIPMHHMLEGVCTKYRGLHETCTSDKECYWGEDMVDKMECSNFVCSCKMGYRPWSGRKCTSAASSNLPATILTLLTSLWIHKMI